mmetsp:Transcript_101049/g.294226  ORF Transcript_101049/g.294226 Transcript_101049/m.294226 type:complete len:223 (-) Transcript_101049:331-999(-)
MGLVAHTRVQYQSANVLPGVGRARHLQAWQKRQAVAEVGRRAHHGNSTHHRSWRRGDRRGPRHPCLGVVAGQRRHGHPLLTPRLPPRFILLQHLSIERYQEHVRELLPLEQAYAATAAVEVHLPLNKVPLDAASADARAFEGTTSRGLVELEGKDRVLLPRFLKNPLARDVVRLSHWRGSPQPSLKLGGRRHLVPKLHQRIPCETQADLLETSSEIVSAACL